MTHKYRLGTVVLSVLLFGRVLPVEAGHRVPLFGVWSGATVGAEPTDDPDVVLVTTAGEGWATQLGHFTMVSPHLSHLVMLEVEGEHIFTAANGDELVGEFTGQFHATPGGFLVAVLPTTIAGGTGRFAGATGHYNFWIIFNPETFESVAWIVGQMSLP